MPKLLKTGLCIVGLLVLTVPVCSYSATILLEAETYSSYSDLSLGGIGSYAGASCTGGHYLGGLDYLDEWVEYGFDVTNFGYYAIQTRVRGDYQTSFLFEVTLTGHPSGEIQTTYIPFTGLGIG